MKPIWFILIKKFLPSKAQNPHLWDIFPPQRLFLTVELAKKLISVHANLFNFESFVETVFNPWSWVGV